jgi:hypothetical protein
MLVMPRKQGVIWTCWDYCGEIPKGLERAKPVLGYQENRLDFTGLGCLGGWEVKTGIRFPI